LMRRLFGVGTPKQCAAMGRGALGAFWYRLVIGLLALMANLMRTKEPEEENYPTCLLCSLKLAA
ncbi:MAG: hypothetical protein JWR69_4652, partial [Pedosphaera sp.]|nr:hypothetical protein [Pedosphaera sp.]